jgi:hypothetical protein
MSLVRKPVTRELSRQMEAVAIWPSTVKTEKAVFVLYARSDVMAEVTKTLLTVATIGNNDTSKSTQSLLRR